MMKVPSQEQWPIRIKRMGLFIGLRTIEGLARLDRRKGWVLIWCRRLVGRTRVGFMILAPRARLTMARLGLGYRGRMFHIGSLADRLFDGRA